MTIRTCVAALALLLAASASFAAEGADASLHEYAQQCTDEIGEIPAFDCNSGTDVPITVNGSVPARYTAHMTCDRPALLPYDAPTSGQCTPYSKILDLSHGDTQISAFCRRKQIRENRSPYYDEVDIVLHHVRNGKTCWFHADKGGTGGMDASRVPPPNENAAARSAVGRGILVETGGDRDEALRVVPRCEAGHVQPVDRAGMEPRADRSVGQVRQSRCRLRVMDVARDQHAR